MGKAHKAPASSYKRTYWVTDHARNRLRTRLSKIQGESINGTEHRSDDDLNNLLDSLVVSAIDQGRHEEVLDKGDEALLVDVRHGLWAIVKDNDVANPKYPKAVVTVLDSEMVEQNKLAGRWDKPKLVGMAEGPREILKQEIQKEVAVEEGSTAIEPILSILITFRTKSGESLSSEWVDVGDAERHLNELRKDQKVDKTSIRVFKQLPIKLSIVI